MMVSSRNRALKTVLVTLCLVLVHCNANRAPLVTSAKTCISDGECQFGFFCDDKVGDFYYNASFTCVPLLKQGERCLNRKCASGLYCDRFDTFSCLPQLSLGSSCNNYFPELCLGYPESTCSQDTSKCVKGMWDTVGSDCSNFGYCNNNLICESKRGSSKCREKKKGGDGCSPFSDECEQICVDTNPDRFYGTHRCSPSVSEGGKCSKASQCSSPDGSEMVCNIPKGNVGICLPVKKVIKKLGAHCNPMNDRCDARRGLSCRWGGNGLKFICVQRASDGDVGVVRHCTPGADKRLSQCKPIDGSPSECRVDEWNPSANTPSESVFPNCMKKRTFLDQGRLCSNGGVCKDGLYCRDSDAVYSSRFGPLVTYCAALVGKGQSCDRINTMCDGSFDCKNSTCVDPPDRPISLAEEYAQLGTVYNGLEFGCGPRSDPCAPGLVCRDSSCHLPVVSLQEGDECYNPSPVQRDCEKGTVCSVNFNGFGVKLCRKPFNVGGVCTKDSQCKNGLRCSEGSVRRCYDPKVSIKVDKPCNPRASASNRKCEPSLKCLASDNGMFVCHRVAGLFKGCDKAKNIVCVEGTRCTWYNVCV